MVEDEDPDALFRVVHPVQPSFQALHNRGEGMLLNQIQQPLFRLEVVVKSRQRHAARAREIAYRGAFVSLLAEDLSSMSEDLRQAPVIARHRNGRGAMPPRSNSGCSGRSPHSSAAIIRTFVRTKYTPA